MQASEEYKRYILQIIVWEKRLLTRDGLQLHLPGYQTWLERRNEGKP